MRNVCMYGMIGGEERDDNGNGLGREMKRQQRGGVLTLPPPGRHDSCGCLISCSFFEATTMWCILCRAFKFGEKTLVR